MDILKKAFIYSLLFLVLTAVTQVGGLIWLFNQILVHLLKKRKLKINRLGESLLFLFIYILANILLIPPLAKLGGRVPLPVTDNVRPLNYFTVICNRHYVVPTMRNVLLDASIQEDIVYLDACFPFWDGFSLLPHLSHNDGRKVDIALYYIHIPTQNLNKHPSLSGYGVFVSPTKEEENMTKICKQKGFWLYDFTKYLYFNIHSQDYIFDANRTRKILLCLTKDPKVKKILLEGHLKKRLMLSEENKIRKPGCHAVRHDDHIHIEI